MNKLLQFVKRNFITKKFLTFGIVGVINTLIHMGVYWIFYNLMFINSLSTSVSAFLANTIAFICASTFSYFANAIFTFKPKNKSTLQFSAVLLVFLVRLLISNGLTTAFDYIIQNWIGIDYSIHSWTSVIAPFTASVLLVPIAYFALDYVFKKTDIKKQTNTLS